MDFSKIIFRRKFAVHFYKDKSLLLSRMCFSKDFIHDRRGNPYPLLEKSTDCTEKVENGLYAVQDGTVQRWCAAFFPYASYMVTIRTLQGTAGFRFHLPDADAFVETDGTQLRYVCGAETENVPLPLRPENEYTLIVSCRPGAFDTYLRMGSRTVFCRTFSCAAFADSDHSAAFSAGYAALSVSGCAVISDVRSVLDCGISQADIRPIRYENGDVMLEQGKLWLTVSVRLQAGCYQGVFSWIPGTAEFELTGALFYDSGDGRWCGDVAASVLYHRTEQRFLLWVCAFSHGHILGHAAFKGDPRFGVNVIDIIRMEKAPDGTPISAFLGFTGDEDPDFVYDAESGKWLMAVCRLDPAIRSYRYVFFASDDPFDGYRCIGQGLDGAETGGSFVMIRGERHFMCGNDFGAVSDYRIYSKDGMQKAIFDRPDGGFRGWGTLIPVQKGSRTAHYLLTFDRHNGSDYNWSYGNLYGFEADI